MSRKNIYIVIILICFAGTAGVLYYGFGSSNSGSGSAVAPPVVAPDSTQITPTNTTPVSAGVRPVSGAPSVFPVDTKFDWTLLDSDNFKGLVSIPDLTLDRSQIGRPNPFSSK